VIEECPQRDIVVCECILKDETQQVQDIHYSAKQIVQ